MTDTKILIVVKEPEPAQAYADALRAIGVACDVAKSFAEMARLAIENAYNGILIDILTLVRSNQEDKVIAYDTINLYPVLRVKWDGRKKQIVLSPLEQSFSPDTGSVLNFFIEHRCRPFPARRLRRHNRKNYNLNLMLSPDGTFSEDNTLKTFSLNISRGGIFVHVCETCQPGQMVWLRLVEYPQLPPVAASVRWSIPWGVSRAIPGAGLKYEQLTEEQQRLLEDLSE